MSRTKFAIYNIASNVGLQIIIAICGFIVPPLIISAFGSEINGLLSTIKQLMNYFSVVSLGIGAATTSALYKPLAKQDFKQVSSIFAATRIFFNQTGYWFGSLVLLAAILLPVLKAGNISQITIFLLVIILGTSAFLEYIITVKYRLLLHADQKNYIGARISAEGSILNALVIVFSIKVGASIVWVQLAASGMYLYRLLGLVHWVKRLYPELDSHATPNFKAISNRWHAFQYQLPDIVIAYTPILIIAVFCGYTEASIYAVYNTIFSALTMIIGIFSVSLAPTFGNLMAEENFQLLHKNYRMYSALYYLILIVCCLSAAILSIPFISLYIHTHDGVNYLIPEVGAFFALRTFTYLLRTPSITLVNAKGLFKEHKKANFYESLGNVLLSIIFVPRWGIAGILAAGTFSSAIRSFLFIYFTEHRFMKESYYKQFIIISLNILVAFFLYLLFPIFQPVSWADWLILSIKVTTLTGGIFSLLMVCLNFKTTKFIITKIRQLYNTNKK